MPCITEHKACFQSLVGTDGCITVHTYHARAVLVDAGIGRKGGDTAGKVTGEKEGPPCSRYGGHHHRHEGRLNHGLFYPCPPTHICSSSSSCCSCSANMEQRSTRRGKGELGRLANVGHSLLSFFSLTQRLLHSPPFYRTHHTITRQSPQTNSKASARMSQSIFNKLQSGLNYLDGAFKETMEGDEEGGEEELVEQRRQVRRPFGRERKGGRM